MPVKQVKVYNPDGGEELHTLPNARDLINIGYTWYPKQSTTPASLSPYRADPKAPAFQKAASQEVFDRFGGQNAEETAAPVTPDEDVEVIEPVAEIVPEVVPVVEEPVKEVAPVELPRSSPRKRFENK